MLTKSKARKEYLLNTPELDSYLEQSSKSSLKGKLLDIIRSDAPTNIIKKALRAFGGYKSLDNIFERLIEQDDNLVKDIGESMRSGPPYFWLNDNSIRVIDDSMSCLGWMDTEKSHSLLMKFAEGDYDLHTRSCAIYAMGQETKVYDAKYVRSLIKLDGQPLLLTSALDAAFQREDLHPTRAFMNVIEPMLAHPCWNIRMYTLDALSTKRPGRNVIRAYIAKLRAAPTLQCYAKDVRHVEEHLDWVLDSKS